MIGFVIRCARRRAGVFRYAGALVAALALAACAQVPTAPSDAGRRTIVLVDPRQPLDETWLHGVFGRATRYSATAVDGRPAIRAVGRRSASGLYRRVRFAAGDCPRIEWSWRVERLQTNADIRRRDGDDVAASLFLLFGDPGPDGRRVPTLRYVWTSDRVAQGSVLASPYYPETVRVVVLRSGTGGLGEWVGESRDLVADFTGAFGRPPPAPVEMVALFTDNDQTAQPVEAYYGPAVVRCGE